MSSGEMPLYIDRSALMSQYVSNNDQNNESDTRYITDQADIINQSYNKIPQYKPNENKKTINPSFDANAFIDNQMRFEQRQRPIEVDRYDPYLDFLFKRGLHNKDNNTRYNVYHINVDSSARTSVANIATSYTVNLKTNPFRIVDDRLWITHEDHPFNVNDRITITGLPSVIKEIRTIIRTGADTVYGIKFTSGSNYAEITCNPNINVVGAGVNYDTNNMYVIISGLKGYPDTTHIGNIPINTLNTRHQVYLVKTGSTDISQNRFFIKLNKAFEGAISTTGYNITLSFNYYGGIRTNEINADYPIDRDHSKGYHLIDEVRKNEYSVKLPRIGHYTGVFGGSNIYVSKVDEIKGGYPDPSNYNVRLGKTFNNVVMVRMISSEFPNTEKVFRDFPEENRNNKLFFQNLDDGDTIYSVEINPGNYDPDGLKAVLEDKFYRTAKVFVPSNSRYTKNNFVKVTIDTSTDIVTFKSYKEAQLIKPIIKVTPNIEIRDTNAGEEKYTITFQHQNHGLSEGDEILIAGSKEHLGIPIDVLNQQQIISKIVDANTYEFELTHFNLNQTKTVTNGGFAVKVYAPNNIRFRFDLEGSMGNELGFRDVGKDIAITPFRNVITNKDLYDNETNLDELGNKKIIKNNSIKLSGNNYIIMTCRQLAGIASTGPIKDFFAKINLSGLPGRILYNTFVNTPSFFYDPIYELSELDITFYNQYGDLYDFNGIDHSFTLEIVCIDETPKGTGISSDIGQEH